MASPPSGASVRYAVLIAFCGGMLVAGVLVPLATRSTDRPTPAAAVGPVTTDASSGAGATTGAAPGVDPSTGTPQGATGSAAAPSATGSRAGTSTAGAARTASDVGVTPDTIKLGVILADLAGVSKLVGGLAGASAQDQQDALQAFIDEANRQGGVNGRKLSAVYTTWDPVAGDANVNCNKLTEDDKVFAVVSEGLYGGPVLCITQQHGTPLLNPGGYIDEYYAKSAGLLFTTHPSKPRSARNGVFELDREGALKGKTIGAFTSRAGDDDVAVDKGLVPALNQLGYKVAHISRLSADNSSSSQIPVEVNQMRAAGVDLVFLETNVVFDTEFVQQADSQGYRPLYALSDSDDNVSDFFLSNMPSTFEAIGISVNRTGEQRTNLPESAIDADCRGVVERATGKTLDRGSAGYGLAMFTCNQIRLLVRGARAAGPVLTRARFSAGMQAIGAFPQAFSGGGSFRAGKFDAADFARPLRSDMGCKCWQPAGDFQRMHS